jgi:hypothetical protein
MDYYACTTQVPNALFDQWMRDLTLSELKLLLLVIRMTRGWVIAGSRRRKVRDWLSSSRILALTGLSDRAITTATGSLISRGLLVVTDAKGNDLSDPRRRQGCMHLYYGLPVDIATDPQMLRSTSEMGAEHDPKAMRTTKPTYTKPTLQKGAMPRLAERRIERPHYSGTLAGLLPNVLSPGLMERLQSNTSDGRAREKST